MILDAVSIAFVNILDRPGGKIKGESRQAFEILLPDGPGFASLTGYCMLVIG